MEALRKNLKRKLEGDQAELNTKKPKLNRKLCFNLFHEEDCSGLTPFCMTLEEMKAVCEYVFKTTSENKEEY